jgi:hypothetical protein
VTHLRCGLEHGREVQRRERRVPRDAAAEARSAGGEARQEQHGLPGPNPANTSR